MKIKHLLFLLVIPFIAACSTTRQSTDVGSLHIEIAKLNKDVRLKDEEIDMLKEKVEKLNRNLLTYEEDHMEDLEDIEAVDIKEVSSALRLGADSSKNYSKIKKQYIRIDVDAKTVQKALKSAGYYKGAIDGKFGTGSQSAVISFQSDHDLKTDGVVGKNTWNILKTYLD